MPDRIYLDHAATTPLRPEAKAAMDAGFAIWANPSSPHAEGRRARAALEDARARVKAALGWDGEVIFASGASEALALAIGRAHAGARLVSVVEHDAVLRPAGEAAVRLPVGPDGLVDLAALEAALAGAGERPLVAVQQVNSETGVIQPLAGVAALVREAGGVLLADCAQGAGKIALPQADMAVVSGHKFGAPVGIGVLLVRDFALLEAPGGQERGYRAGTEAMPLALGMAAALEAGDQWLKPASSLRDSLESQLVAAGCEVIAASSPRLATIGAYRMPGLSSAAQLIRFDAAGIAVSAGSACSSGSLRPSHVLAAMGMEQPALGEVVRVSIGRETRGEDIDRFAAEWRAIAATRRAA